MSVKSSVTIEVRPGAGGEEAKIWANDLLRMYSRYASAKDWQVKPVGDAKIKITGERVNESLKYEGGVHRVQRIPETESRGRIHTSTATVVVIPEMGQVTISIDPNDLEWQFFRASTQGGQNVQKVSTAVRLIHKPTGIVVESQRERFQEQNRRLALKKLEEQLEARQQSQHQAQVNQFREVIGEAERAEKIRTYNYPRNQVIDHRIDKKWQDLENIVDGKLKKVIKSLQSRLA